MPRPGPPAMGGPPGRGGLLAALAGGQSGLKKSSGNLSDGSPGASKPKAASPGPMSMMDQIKAAKLKQKSGGGARPPVLAVVPNAAPKAAPKGMERARVVRTNNEERSDESNYYTSSFRSSACCYCSYI